MHLLIAVRSDHNYGRARSSFHITGNELQFPSKRHWLQFRPEHSELCCSFAWLDRDRIIRELRQADAESSSSHVAVQDVPSYTSNNPKVKVKCTLPGVHILTMLAVSSAAFEATCEHSSTRLVSFEVVRSKRRPRLPSLPSKTYQHRPGMDYRLSLLRQCLAPSNCVWPQAASPQSQSGGEVHTDLPELGRELICTIFFISLFPFITHSIQLYLHESIHARNWQSWMCSIDLSRRTSIRYATRRLFGAMCFHVQIKNARSKDVTSHWHCFWFDMLRIFSKLSSITLKSAQICSYWLTMVNWKLLHKTSQSQTASSLLAFHSRDCLSLED